MTAIAWVLLIALYGWESRLNVEGGPLDPPDKLFYAISLGAIVILTVKDLLS